MKRILILPVNSIIIFCYIAFGFTGTGYVDSGSASNYRNIISCIPENNQNKNGNLSDRFSWETSSLEEIAVNDNRQTAGEMKDGELYLDLETRQGAWYPETHDGKALPVYAFAEKGKPLQLPGPQIRIPEGTVIHASIHNSIPGFPLVLHGFYSRPGNPKDSIAIPSGDTYQVVFKAGKAGTYFYWATDGNIKVPDSDMAYFNDSQLYGAFIVDAPATQPDPLERVIMIGIWNDTLNGLFNGEELVLNGRTWPYTERLNYERDKPVHWRVINASNQEHPMHLHGFYYTVNSRGNADTDHVYNSKERYLSITELLQPHETMSMTWTPEREGNWLFHCHTLVHIMVGSFLRDQVPMTEEQMNDITKHAKEGMGGLIMGITVNPPEKEKSKITGTIPERQLTLIVREIKNFHDTLTGKGFILKEGNNSSDLNGSIPGPPIILERGKPVAIKIINRLKESTTIHWHGLEIESYFDGVAGWGNRGKELAPLILPGDSFTVHMTPPRAGTFMYHTHMHNLQLMEGMSGPFIVTESGKHFNEANDKIFFISQGGVDFDNRLLFLNGKTNKDTMLLQRGKKYRFRMINITALGPDLMVSLLQNGKPVFWRALAIDGAELTAGQQNIKPADKQSVTIGKTMDFEFDAAKPGVYLMAILAYDNSHVLEKVILVK